MFKYRIDNFGRKWVSCELFDFGSDAGRGAIARVNIDKMFDWIHHDELHNYMETARSWRFLEGSDSLNLYNLIPHFKYWTDEEYKEALEQTYFIHVDSTSYGVQETMWVCICDETYKYTDERIGVIWSLADEPCFDMEKADQLDYEWQMNAYNSYDYHIFLEQLQSQFYNWYDWTQHLIDRGIDIDWADMLTDVIQEVANSGNEYLTFDYDGYELDEDEFFDDCVTKLFEELRKFFANPEYGPHKRKLQRERWLKLC